MELQIREQTAADAIIALEALQSALERRRVFFDTSTRAARNNRSNSVIISAGEPTQVEGLDKRLSVIEKLVALTMGYVGINSGFTASDNFNGGFNSMEEYIEPYKQDARFRINLMIGRIAHAKRVLKTLES